MVLVFSGALASGPGVHLGPTQLQLGKPAAVLLKTQSFAEIKA